MHDQILEHICGMVTKNFLLQKIRGRIIGNCKSIKARNIRGTYCALRWLAGILKQKVLQDSCNTIGNFIGEYKRKTSMFNKFKAKQYIFKKYRFKMIKFKRSMKRLKSDLVNRFKKCYNIYQKQHPEKLVEKSESEI